jgi:hypothetical protein
MGPSGFIEIKLVFLEGGLSLIALCLLLTPATSYGRLFPFDVRKSGMAGAVA